MIDIGFKVKKLYTDVILPKYQTAGAGCFDLHWYCREPYRTFDFPKNIDEAIWEHEFETGLVFEIPKDYVVLIFSRSGHGFKHNLRLANCVGVIDSDYRGEVKVKLTQDSDVHPARIQHGDRIAQAQLFYSPQYKITEVQEVQETARGTGGFGSTG